MVIVGLGTLSFEQIKEVVEKDQKISLDKVALNQVRESHEFLKDFSKNKIIYGINTGFGPMAQYRIDEGQQIELQYNLIRSHCSGSGKSIDPVYSRSLTLARLNTLMLGYSGIHEDVVLKIQAMLNAGLSPVIYEHGSVGASGDLVQLAHLALALIGEGEVWENNEIYPSAEAFERHGIEPIKVHIREGLALLNGTSSMSGIGLVNVLEAQRLLDWSILAGALLNEVVSSYNDHFSKELNQTKRHPGQQNIAKAIREALEGSTLIKRRHEHLFQEVKDDVFKEKVQEYYSLRCIPQILGPVLDTLKYTEQILVEEVNSANDNPIVDRENEYVFHGGNFHGDYVALEMDKLKLAITKLSMLLERQINFLFNSRLNAKLPPFLNLGKLGFNYGLQGVQFTAVSTTAENQSLSNSVYIHSIPNNNDNQDIVSMGTNAALICGQVIRNSFEVLTVEWMALLHAVEYLKIEDKLAPETRKWVRYLRNSYLPPEQDSPLFKKQRALTKALKKEGPKLIFK